MNGGTNWRARVGLGLLAAAGVGGAHRLAYWIVSPDAHLRAELLEHTGHRYFGLVSGIVFGLFAATAGGFVSSRARKASAPLGRAHVIALAARLGVLQAAGWLALEGAERLLVAHHHGSMFEEPVLWVGLVVQLVAAAVSALLFAGLDRAITIIVAWSNPPLDARAPRPSWPPRRAWAPPAIGLGDAWSCRAPPAALQI